ncbi:MAG: tripartite tricarboxylate transporter substrate binding protein [Candidatus Accumulibacter sp.]|jgi:tripartite-type tricarboxylate transporter receptor subunit TctC|nr:tripartite tricarboxylate transporter substrate binding protein [Accumulibacter sp.]
MMNKFLALTHSIFLVSCLVPAIAVAQTYPVRPITLIVPQPPGGNNDIVARTFGQKLAERIGQPVVVDNRPGAGGTLGTGIAARSENDGYTIVIGDVGTMVIAKHTQPNVPYNALKDFSPIAAVTTVSIVVAAQADSPYNNIQDVITAAKAEPGRLTSGSGGVGSTGHLALELVRSMAGVDILHVPFKGGAQAMTGLIGGQVDLMIDGAALALAKSGKIKPIAVTGPRLTTLPDIPGIGETVKGFNFVNWFGFFAPAGTPKPIIEKLNQEFRAIASMPEIRERLTNLGLNAEQNGTPQQFAEVLQQDTEKIARIIKDANLKFN